jgi:hypothetical protein
MLKTCPLFATSWFMHNEGKLLELLKKHITKY